MDPGVRTILSAVLSGVRPGTVPRFLQKLFPEEMEEFARIVSPYAGIVRLRGID